MCIKKGFIHQRDCQNIAHSPCLYDERSVLGTVISPKTSDDRQQLDKPWFVLQDLSAFRHFSNCGCSGKHLKKSLLYIIKTIQSKNLQTEDILYLWWSIKCRPIITQHLILTLGIKKPVVKILPWFMNLFIHSCDHKWLVSHLYSVRQKREFGFSTYHSSLIWFNILFEQDTVNMRDVRLNCWAL